MPVSLRRGAVTALVERHEELMRIEVDGAPCVAYPRVTGPVELGDEVLVNVQAVELGLGSGGFDVLYANLTRGLGLGAEPGAHVMVLPYAPGQFAVRHVEEDGELGESLGGMPVVCCTLHSQLAPACAGLGKGMRVAYLQLGGGALPVALSDAVRVSFGDERKRHQGVSHHTRAVLELLVRERVVAWPAGLERPDWLEVEEIAVDDWRDECGALPLEHMGRGPDDDPWFFTAAFAAGGPGRGRGGW